MGSIPLPPPSSYYYFTLGPSPLLAHVSGALTTDL